jgi:hypothetical protein
VQSAAPDTLVTAQSAMERNVDALGAPPERASGYRVNVFGGPALNLQEATELRTAVHTAGWGQGDLDVLLMARAVAHASTNSTTLEIEERRTRSDLQRLWGTDFDAKIGHAQAEAKRLIEVSPLAKTILGSTIAGSNKVLIKRLADLGERRASKGTT